MLNQKLKKLVNFFTPGKKNVLSAEGSEETFLLAGKDTKRNVRLLYHQDTDILQTANAKAETQQHDWWIN